VESIRKESSDAAENKKSENLLYMNLSSIIELVNNAALLLGLSLLYDMFILDVQVFLPE